MNPTPARLLVASLAACLGGLAPSDSRAAEAATPQRQAEVASRGADVMPFSLAATTHVFTKTPDGGTQRVVAKDPADARQVALVRQHLHELRGRFLAGDFGAPAQIHGASMPGLATLRAARPGQLAIDYREVDAGAELAFRSADASLVAAVHDWFDAQLADHGHDATSGDMGGDMQGHHHHAP